jgi:hypothetical protein
VPMATPIDDAGGNLCVWDAAGLLETLGTLLHVEQVESDTLVSAMAALAEHRGRDGPGLQAHPDG